MKRIWKDLFCGKASGRLAEAGSVKKNRAVRQAAGTLAKAAALLAGTAVMMWDLGGHHCPGGTERSLYHIQL